MSKQGKINLIFTLLLVMCIFSCKKQENKSRIFYMSSIIIVGNQPYNQLYQQAHDSIELWADNNLALYDENKNGFFLDSLICFNNKGDKCVMSLAQQNYEENDAVKTSADYMQFFYGVKIKNKWYFFKGANIVLPREMYVSKDKIHEPLSFSKLHQIALEEVFGGYLIKKKKDVGWWKNLFNPEYEYEINERWFDSHFKTSWGYYKNDKFITPSTQEEWDSMYIEKAQSIWEK